MIKMYKTELPDCCTECSNWIPTVVLRDCKCCKTIPDHCEVTGENIGKRGEYQRGFNCPIVVLPTEEELEGYRQYMIDQAGRYVIERDKASIGLLVNQFRISCREAAELLKALEDAGAVKNGKVIMTKEEWDVDRTNDVRQEDSTTI